MSSYLHTACCFGCNEVLVFLSSIIKIFGPSLITIGVGTLLVQKFFVARSNQAAFIDMLVRELDNLRADSLEYWSLHNEEKEDIKKQGILTEKIKGAIRGLAGDFDYYSERYCKGEKEKMNKLLMEVADACTGGTFESKAHSADASRYLLVVNSTNRVRSELFKGKL